MIAVLRGNYSDGSLIAAGPIAAMKRMGPQSFEPASQFRQNHETIRRRFTSGLLHLPSIAPRSSFPFRGNFIRFLVTDIEITSSHQRSPFIVASCLRHRLPVERSSGVWTMALIGNHFLRNAVLIGARFSFLHSASVAFIRAERIYLNP